MKAQSQILDPEGQHLRSAFLAAGTDTIFNLDILRHTHESKTDNLLILRLDAITNEDRPLVHEFIPILFVQYAKAINARRGAVFSQGSQAQPGVLLEQVRQSTMNFFMLLLRLIIIDGSDEKSAWQTRLALLRTVDEENLFSQKQVESQATIDRVLALVMSSLNEGLKGKFECLLKRSTSIANIKPMQTNVRNALMFPSNVSRRLPALITISYYPSSQKYYP